MYKPHFPKVLAVLKDTVGWGGVQYIVPSHIERGDGRKLQTKLIIS